MSASPATSDLTGAEGDPNALLTAAPRSEWVRAGDLIVGDEVLQGKYIYRVSESHASDEHGWTLVLTDARDFREGFKLDRVFPRERRLSLSAALPYRRIVTASDGQ